jgi:hypothetical protein
MDSDLATRPSSSSWTTVTCPGPTLIILDRGDEAWPARIRLDEPASVGLSFWHRGLRWRIARGRTSWRTFVAEPVPA